MCNKIQKACKLNEHFHRIFLKLSVPLRPSINKTASKSINPSHTKREQTQRADAVSAGLPQCCWSHHTGFRLTPFTILPLSSLIFCQTTRVWQWGQLANGTLKPPTVHTWRMKLRYVLLIVTLSLASLSWSSSSEKLKPATVMKSPITATNLSPRSLVLLCW